MHRLRPEAVAVLGGQLLELEAEDLPERGGRCRAHFVDCDGSPALQRQFPRHRREGGVLEPAGVIHSVNGAGSRSTLSA